MLNNRDANPGPPRETTIALAAAVLCIVVASFALLYSLRPRGASEPPAAAKPSAAPTQAVLNTAGMELCRSVIGALRSRAANMFSDCQFMHLEGSGDGYDITVNVDPAKWRALAASQRAQLLDTAAGVERKTIVAHHGNAGASMLEISAPTGTELARRVLNSAP